MKAQWTWPLRCILQIAVNIELLRHTLPPKKCAQCDLDSQSPENRTWYGGHKQDCDINHTGSGMECDVAKILWKKSVERHGVWYTIMLSDGDAKTF